MEQALEALLETRQELLPLLQQGNQGCGGRIRWVCGILAASGCTPQGCIYKPLIAIAGLASSAAVAGNDSPARAYTVLCQSKHLPSVSPSNELPGQKAEQASQQSMQHTDMIASTPQVMHCKVPHAAKTCLSDVCVWVEPSLRFHFPCLAVHAPD